MKKKMKEDDLFIDGIEDKSLEEEESRDGGSGSDEDGSDEDMEFVDG